uniref:Uncharacterized protein n=1 Tax=Romanomermis culicivorax TaxID=13658 RepID=A0A915J1M9_ROMCU
MQIGYHNGYLNHIIVLVLLKSSDCSKSIHRKRPELFGCILLYWKFTSIYYHFVYLRLDNVTWYEPGYGPMHMPESGKCYCRNLLPALSSCRSRPIQAAETDIINFRPMVEYQDAYHKTSTVSTYKT